MGDKGEKKKRSKNKNAETLYATKLRENPSNSKMKRRFNPVVVFEQDDDDFVQQVSKSEVTNSKISKIEVAKKTKPAAKSKIAKKLTSKVRKTVAKTLKSIEPPESKLETEQASTSRISKTEIVKNALQTNFSTPKLESNSGENSKNISQLGGKKLKFPISSSPIVQLAMVESVLGRRRSGLSRRPKSPLVCSTSASLNDTDFYKLLQCKDCSVKLVRLKPEQIPNRHTTSTVETTKIVESSLKIQTECEVDSTSFSATICRDRLSYVVSPSTNFQTGSEVTSQHGGGNSSRPNIILRRCSVVLEKIDDLSNELPETVKKVSERRSSESPNSKGCEGSNSKSSDVEIGLSPISGPCSPTIWTQKTEDPVGNLELDETWKQEDSSRDMFSDAESPSKFDDVMKTPEVPKTPDSTKCPYSGDEEVENEMTGIKSFYEYQTFFGDADTSEFDIDFNHTLLLSKTRLGAEINSSNSNKNSPKSSQKTWSSLPQESQQSYASERCSSETLKISPHSKLNLADSSVSSQSTLKSSRNLHTPKSDNLTRKSSQKSFLLNQNSQTILNSESHSSQIPISAEQNSQHSLNLEGENSSQGSTLTLKRTKRSLFTNPNSQSNSKSQKSTQSPIPFIMDNNTPSSLSSFPNLIPLNQASSPERSRSIGKAEAIEASQTSPMESTTSQDQVYLVPTRKAPTRLEVFDTMLELGVFQAREKEELKHSVFVSEKSDLLGTRSKVEIGREKLRLGYQFDLPKFESALKSQQPSKNDYSGKDDVVMLECVKKPPTYQDVAKTISNKMSSKNQSSPKKFKTKFEKEKLRRKGLKQNSDAESEESELSLSMSSDNGDTTSEDSDIINCSQEVQETEVEKSKLSGTQLRRKFRQSSSRIISGNHSLSNPHGFKTNFQNLKTTKASTQATHVKLLSLEVHVVTRSRLLPDPEYDTLSSLFFVFFSDEGCGKVCQRSGEPTQNGSCIQEGIFVLDIDVKDESDVESAKRRDIFSRCGVVNKNVTYFGEEREMILAFVEMVKIEDPDILVGYEIQQSSWGFLVKRSQVKYELNLAPLLSRLPDGQFESKIMSSAKHDNLATDPDLELVLSGRIVLNVGKLMRSELALTSYSAENLFYHVLHERVPKFDHKTLTHWWTSSRANLDRWRVIDYYLIRSHGNLRLLDQLDVIGRTSELARLFGIQFNEVLTRGSQFRVESIMLRLVKARNFIPVSSSVQQRAKMRAPEYLPLVMEPESRFYSDPVVVLDFQSLYPSIIMAYNYCYSTCLGRIVHHLEDQLKKEDNKTYEQTYRFGCTDLQISLERLAKLEGHLTFSPGGVAFLKPHVRRGILPKMLEEILDTRQMVKRSMKLYNQRSKNNPEFSGENGALQKILHSRQLGLKLIANVTYGYTAANFSGRMPCIEVGDSVVSKGRETLVEAIKFIENNSRPQQSQEDGPQDGGGPQSQSQKSHTSKNSWNSDDAFGSGRTETPPKCSVKWPGARVVYGDTDSLFIVLPGRTKDEAFRIGEEMAEEVSKLNPKPVKLKFEKVYQPCILQTKKRYVGYMYETPDQEKPVYEAKGIETVRRDGIPSIVKILEKSLRILFETKDVSLVKRFVQRQFGKITSGKIPLQDLTFAREFRGMTGYRPGACVPALELSKRLGRLDRMSLPPSGHRVPYVIVYGEPGRPLFHSVRSPQEVLEAQYPKGEMVGLLRPNTHYYITKVIVPALNRCFSLLGADVMKWFKEMPKILPKSLLMMGPNESQVCSTANLFFDQESGVSLRPGQGRRGQIGLAPGGPSRQGVILQYFTSSQCVVCDKAFTQSKKNLDPGQQSSGGKICPECLSSPQKVAIVLSNKMRTWDRTYDQLSRICSSCAGNPASKDCQSYDCPVIYQRVLAEAEAQQIPVVQHILSTLLLDF